MQNILINEVLNLELLGELQKRPEPFASGEPLFWDDPHIAQQMLQAHLNPNTDAASYRPETIEQIVSWLVGTLSLGAASDSEATAVLDCGCGPGLYTSRLAKLGMQVTGVDYSRNSIAYARDFAREHDLPITYRYENYLELADEDEYDVVMLISGDFCPLSPENRKRLLGNVRRALRENGRFVLDVTTGSYRYRTGEKNWYVAEGGFWRPGWHLVLEQGLEYGLTSSGETAVHLDQYIVIEADGTCAVYHNWVQEFTLETITAELEQNGFAVEFVGSDLMGTPLAAESEMIGIVARKR